MLLALTAIADAKRPRPPLELLVGKEVVATLKPKNVFVWAGPPPPPGMVTYEGLREVYTAILVRIEKDSLRLAPLPTAPKFEPGGLPYLSETGVRRDEVESVRPKEVLRDHADKK